MEPITLQLKQPEPIDLETNAVEDIRRFRHEFLLLCNLLGVDRDVGEDVKFGLMRLQVGSAASQIITNLLPTMREQDQKRVDVILSRLEEYFSEKTDNILFDRLCFHRIRHQVGESLDDYAERIRYQAAKCRFECDVENKMLEQFMVGLQCEDQINFILTEGGDNVTFKETCHLSKIWWAENAVLHPPGTPIPVTLYANQEFKSGSIPMPMKEEKVFTYPAPGPSSAQTPPLPANQDHDASSTESEEFAPIPKPIKKEEEEVTHCVTDQSFPQKSPQSENQDHDESSTESDEFALIPMPIKKEEVVDTSCATDQSSLQDDHDTSSTESDEFALIPMPMKEEKVVDTCATDQLSPQRSPQTANDDQTESDEFAPVPVLMAKNEEEVNTSPQPPPQLANNEHAASSSKRQPRNSNIGSSQAQTFDVGTFIVLKKNRMQPRPVLWKVHTGNMREKYLPYRGRTSFRSTSSYIHWDGKDCADYVKVPVMKLSKKSENGEEFELLQVEVGFLKSKKKI